MSQGEGDARGPWNQGDGWDYVDEPLRGATGDGGASVQLPGEDLDLLENAAARTLSNVRRNPPAGAELGNDRERGR